MTLSREIRIAIIILHMLNWNRVDFLRFHSQYSPHSIPQTHDAQVHNNVQHAVRRNDILNVQVHRIASKEITQDKAITQVSEDCLAANT